MMAKLREVGKMYLKLHSIFIKALGITCYFTTTFCCIIIAIAAWQYRNNEKLLNYNIKVVYTLMD